MKLWEFEDEKVKITTTDGQVFRGIASDYTNPQDNEPEIASICVGDTEFLETEIKSIEVVK